MNPTQLNILRRPSFRQPRLLLGFSGWMDGGEVSTGVINLLQQELDAKPLAEIDPTDFYILSFPGNMEVSAMFRPHVKINDGLIESYEMASNEFYASPDHDLILFNGKEPNFNWHTFAECVFAVCSEFGVREVYFIGSVAGAVPHTREPRLSSSVSDVKMKEHLGSLGVRFSNYEGPASFITHLLHRASDKGYSMATLVAEIPAYVQGTNPKCIEAVARRLAGMLNLPIELNSLREVSDMFEHKLSEAVADKDDLQELIAKLEEDYDNDVFDNQMGDLKAWLEQKGVRLD